MNVPTDPRELASAIVDGLLSDDEASRAMAQPAVAAHVDEMLQLRDLLRAVPQPDELSKARVLNAATEAGMEAQRQSFQPAAPSSVLTLERRKRMPAWLAVAAVVAVLALAAGLITSLGDNQGDSVASSDSEADTSAVDESSDSADGNEGSATEGGEGDQGAGGSVTAETEEQIPGRAGETYLGSVDDENELAALAFDDYLTHAEIPESPEPQAGQEDTATANEEGESEVCPARTQAGDPDHGTSVNIATAGLDGEFVWVHLYEQSDDDELLMVATNESCVDVAEELIEP